MVKFFYNERGQRIKKESYNTSTFALNSTDYYILDLSGNAMAIYNQPVSSAITQKDLPIFGLSRLGVCNRTGSSNYEITDHLGNVRAVIQKLSGNPVIKSFADYYPFGEQLVGRSVTNDYRYAFQGQELDGETGMEAFQLRLWDGRIGRWLSPDPMGQHFSPYAGMGNNPVSHIDPDGGYETALGAFFGWVGSGFRGSITSNPNAEKANFKYVVEDRGSDKTGTWIWRKTGGVKSEVSAGSRGGITFHDPWPNSKWDWFENRKSGFIDIDQGTLKSGFIGDMTGKKNGVLYGVAHPFMNSLMGTGIDRLSSRFWNGLETGMDAYTQGGSIYSTVTDKSETAIDIKKITYTQTEKVHHRNLMGASVVATRDWKISAFIINNDTIIQSKNIIK